MTTSKFHISEEVKKLLDSLEDYLILTKQQATFRIIGSFSLELQGYKRKISTRDIDLIEDVENEELASKISELGNKIGSDIMNLDAFDIPQPEGMAKRSETIEYNDRISFIVPCREDAILLKVAALIDRILDEDKDADDLRLLNTTKDDFEKGVQFYRDTGMKEIKGTPFESDVEDRIALARRKLGF